MMIEINTSTSNPDEVPSFGDPSITYGEGTPPDPDAGIWGFDGRENSAVLDWKGYKHLYVNGNRRFSYQPGEGEFSERNIYDKWVESIAKKSTEVSDD